MPPTPLPAWPYPRLIAHRGGGVAAAENTLAGMRAGLEHGYRMAEYDAKLSRDGVCILLHDDTLERTTDGSGPAAGRDYAELAQLDAGSWHSAGSAGQAIPTLRAVARYTQANGIASNVEIKPCPGREAETGEAVGLAVRQLWHGAACAPLVSSFSDVALAAAARAAPELRRAWLLENALPPDWQARAAALGCVSLNLNNRHLTEEVVRRVHAAGLRVVAWTVNDLARATTLRDWGVDGIVTDQLELLSPLRDSAAN